MEKNGRKGLECQAKLLSDFFFDEIIKISYRHFLCLERKKAIICRFNDIGYENVHENSPMSQMLAFRSKSRPPDLKSLLAKICRDFPKAFEDIAMLLKPYTKGRYISEYNHFSAFVDDVHFSWAVQRVVMDNHFMTETLDIKYGALANGK